VSHWKAWLVLGLIYFLPFWFVFQTPDQARQYLTTDLSNYPWIYLRGGLPLEPDEKVVDGIFTGDILCGREGKSLDLDLRQAAPWLRAADFAMGNLECAVTSQMMDGEVNPKQDREAGPYLLYTSPQKLKLLREAGFDILGVANNHAFDLGEAGLTETIWNLHQNGILAAGVCSDRNYKDAMVVKYIGKLRIAIVAVNAISPPNEPVGSSMSKPSVLEWDSSQLLFTLIQSIRQEVNAVIVYIHWGSEYELKESPAQREIAVQLLSAGADMVVGHHPHVVQGVDVFLAREGWTDGFVAYSLGNFAADQQFGDTAESMVLRAYFDKLGLRAVQALPIKAGASPRLLDMEQASLMFERILPEEKQLIFTCDRDTCQDKSDSIESLPSGSGLFWSGEADLTGDGIPEQVQRQAGKVIVYQGGEEDWRTPPSWRIEDLALGDPDGDGRLEMMMAFWRADQSGVLRSHPFIVGYRGGTYHETWGGSGVSDPILEVELGDVDHDGAEELVVLEQHSNRKEAVTVWDWHGWGFSLKWRSPEGEYRDLRVRQNQQTRETMIWVAKQAYSWSDKD
jgi:poly-gamma-glutamate capsule biosynthesis protein CapA/YwtB (metallophosphatase superfamily)